jgi:hypothetical protein
MYPQKSRHLTTINRALATCCVVAHPVLKQIFSSKRAAAGRLEDFPMALLVCNFLSSNVKLVEEANTGKILCAFIECHLSCDHSKVAFMLGSVKSRRVERRHGKEDLAQMYIENPFPGPSSACLNAAKG